MKKIIYRSLASLVLFILIILVYLSIFGIKTDRFNSKIKSQIHQIEPNIEIKLNDVSATIDLLNLGIKAKTIGTDLIYRGNIIKIETIKANISLKSFLNKKFALTGISISTKSLGIKDLISFFRLLNNDPKLFIAEQFIKNGYLVADLKVEFDENGNIKNNYKFNGLVKDGKISLFKKFNLSKIDFIFNINKEDLILNDIKLLLNNKNILIPELTALRQNEGFSISGKLNTKNTTLTKNEINNFIKAYPQELNIDEILFNSKNIFSFKLSKKIKIKDFKVKSEIDINKLKLLNSFKLNDIFPKIKKDFLFENQKLKLEYEKDNLSIDGEGEVLFQNEMDRIKYQILKRKNEIKFNTTLIISKNLLELDLLNYKKKKNSNLELNFQGKKIKKTN